MNRKWMFILLVTLFAAAILASFISTPKGIRQKSSNSSLAPCINTLRQIDGAKQQWALENHKTTNDVPLWPEIAICR
jgi:4-amino-4-deoxy-L-arabinose transferase-like glycosyltransferase